MKKSVDQGITQKEKLIYPVFSFSLIILYPLAIPIHFVNPDDMKWIHFTDPTRNLSFQYPNSTDWKINLNNEILNDIYYIQVYHMDEYSNVLISLKIIPFDNTNRNKVFDFNLTIPYKYPLTPEMLTNLFENYNKNDQPDFSVFEKHSDKYTINGNKASGILTRHSYAIGNTTGMLTLYSVDNKNNLIIEFKYIFDPNSFMTYLPIAEKILDSIRIKN
jgi:hypothetical protein